MSLIKYPKQSTTIFNSSTKPPKCITEHSEIKADETGFISAAEEERVSPGYPEDIHRRDLQNPPVKKKAYSTIVQKHEKEVSLAVVPIFNENLH